jgi:fatty-acyl-CoA synthase
MDPATVDASVSKAWLRALELTASISRNRDRVFSDVMEELGVRFGDAPALLSDRECFSYRSLVERSHQYARWALEQGVAKGDVVGLLMPNRPEYVALWLGITSVGGVVALLNTNLPWASLAHCIGIVRPQHLIADCECIGPLSASLQESKLSPTVWIHGAGHEQFSRIDHNIDQQSCEGLSGSERPVLTIEDRALYIFTSGTTGLPKAASVSHARVLQWSYWFAGMMGVQSSDRMYNCLPMYHSIGGVLAPGATLIGGGSVVIREKFSASHFWSDIVRWDCTIFQYIGEFCRYLLHADLSSEAQNHRIRLACGNGMAPDVWDEFKERFHIPRILEFYAATEGNISLFNVEGKRGAIGRVPPYLAHRFSPVLVRFDVEAGEPVRNEQGLCVRCDSNEPGEAIGKVLGDASNIGSRFDGYTDEQATESKILRNVFEPNDAWVRTGDLMRKDDAGFFYFVDRVGDTFRWKGENVATSEVSATLCAFPGVKHAIVYGVSVPGNEGRVGMAALVADQNLDLSALRLHTLSRLPYYARPAFLRLQQDVQVTGTLKYSRADLVGQAFNPSLTTDAIYFDSPELQLFTRLDETLFDRIQRGQIRL